MCNCLYCYRPLLKGEKDMHTACIKKFFGTTTLPVLDYTIEQLDRLAMQIIQDQTSLTGVQPKLSLHLNEHEGSKRLTIVGLWSGYICKPQTSQYKMMPEVEDLTMHLAEIAHIDVVPHTNANGRQYALLSYSPNRQNSYRREDSHGRYVPAD